MKILTCILLVFVSCTCIAQRDLPQIDDNYQKYLDDGRKTDADADVKISLTALVSGFIELGYEHKINNTWSLVGSGGFQFIEGLDPQSFQYGEVAQEVGGVLDNGFSLSIEGRRYAGLSAITDIGYAGFKYRVRHSNTYAFSNTTVNGKEVKKNGDIIVSKHDFYYSRGGKYLLGSSVSAEFSAGIGVRVRTLNSLTEVFGMWNVEGKIGYYIKY